MDNLQPKQQYEICVQGHSRPEDKAIWMHVDTVWAFSRRAAMQDAQQHFHGNIRVRRAA
jgi:hypothetical protein